MFSFFFKDTQPSFKESIGRATWSLLHAVADRYPSEFSEAYTREFQSLLSALSVIYPCDACREHIQSYLKEHPPRFENRAHAVRWVFNFHNAVNVRLGKPKFTAEAYLRRENVAEIGGTKCGDCGVV